MSYQNFFLKKSSNGLLVIVTITFSIYQYAANYNSIPLENCGALTMFCFKLALKFWLFPQMLGQEMSPLWEYQFPLFYIVLIVLILSCTLPKLLLVKQLIYLIYKYIFCMSREFYLKLLDCNCCYSDLISVVTSCFTISCEFFTPKSQLESTLYLLCRR